MKVRILMVFLFSFGVMFSQAPQKINYQGVARNSSGTALANTNLSFTLGISNSSGSYSETQNVTSNAVGIFTLQIGAGSPVSGSFAGIDWSASPTNLSVSMDDGTGPVSFGPQQLVSVPYALYAEKAGSAPSPALTFAGGVLTVGTNSILIPSSSYTAGTGISISSGIITNTAPDQTVNISPGSNITVNGAYPNYTISSSAATPSITGTGITTVNQSGNSFTVGTISPTLTGIGATTITGTYPSYTINTVSTSTAAGVTSIVAGNGLSGAPVNTITSTGTLSLANSGVTAGAYGAAPSTAAIFTVDATGRITNAANLSISSPTAISGDAQGPLGSTTVTAIQGQPVSATAPSAGQMLEYNGSSWAPFTPTVAATPWYKPSAAVVGLTTISDNVGIGTITPAAKVDIFDNNASTTFNVFNNNTGSYACSLFNSMSTLYSVRAANDGTGAALDVFKSASASTGRAAQFMISNPTNTSDAVYATTSGSGAAGNFNKTAAGSVLVANHSGTSGSAAMISITNPGNSSQALNVLTNGNGDAIGVSNISNGRAINATSNGTAITVFANNTNSGYALQAQNTASGRAGMMQGGLDVIGKSVSSSSFALNVQNNALTNLLNVRDDGYIGINNNAPVSQLDIVSSSFNVLRLATTGANSNTNIDAYPTGAGQLYFRVPGNNGIGFSTNGGTRMTIDPSGRVGIGTSSPTKTLEVAGNVRINDGTQGLNKVLTSDASGNASWQNPPPPPPQIGFFAGNNPVANQAIPAAAFTTVVFGTGYAFFNDGGGFNTGTNQFTPPSAGVYQINAYINYTGASPGAALTVMLRYPAGHIIRMDGTVPSTGDGSVTLSCTVNSNITSGPYWIDVYCSSAMSINEYNSGFSGHKVY